MTAYGTAEFDNGVTGEITDLELRDGVLILIAKVEHPCPSFDANRWRVLGRDGSLIYVVTEDREPLIQSARDRGGITTLYLPLGVSNGFGPIEALGGPITYVPGPIQHRPRVPRGTPESLRE